MGTIIYELRDHLNHPKYEWPLSLVRYPLKFESGEAHPDSFKLLDEAGNSVAVQITGAVLQDGFVTGGEVVFLTDLPRAGSHCYELHYHASPLQAEAIDKHDKREPAYRAITVVAADEAFLSCSNGLLEVRVPRAGFRLIDSADSDGVKEVFYLGPGEGQELAKAGLVSDQRLIAFESECVASGPVVFEHRISYVLESGGHYSVRIRLIAGMPYIELEEEMESIAADAGMKLNIVWEGLDPTRRYSRYRGEEAIDAYLDESGELPFRVLPYDNSRSWHRSRSAAFTDEEKQLVVGVFHGDSMKWNDGEYALWRSSDTLAIRFYYGCCKHMDTGAEYLHWSYPLSSGSRATKIALYDMNRGRAADASTALRKPEAGGNEPLIEELALWHSFLPLQKVKDWILDWEEPQEQYPLLFELELLPDEYHWWYFDRNVPPQPSDLEEIIDKLSFSFNQVGSTSPVTSREFSSWVPIFDLSARAMTAEQFKRFKAASAFMAYVREDEYTAPIRTMLAGHPNFLADFKAVPGYMSALFPHHPHARRWRQHFEQSIALNLKYHTRPAVKAWEAEGGRWTENLGCYVWAALVPSLRAAWCIRRSSSENPMLYSNLASLARWLLGSLSAPVAGRCSYPPQGAHSGVHHDPIYPPYALRVLGEFLMQWEPLLAEQLLAVCPADADGFESAGKGDIWRCMLEGQSAGNSGTPPLMKSTKFTGYGMVLRAAVQTPGEVSVHLQQIDEGPNYRWGRSGSGGNGVIYYYADGKRYSYNRPEDVGDDNMGAGEGSSSFAVLNGHEYVGIGRSELTGPLHDFGFAQYALLEAGPESRPMYRTRSVIMSGNDYIVIYDEVADMRVRGRFSWFTQRGEEFPGIYQLKPGAAAAEVSLGGPVDIAPQPPGGYARNVKHGYPDGSKGRYYDGFGDFLTVVTHRGVWQPQLTSVKATNYGAIVSLCGRTDYVFRSASRIRHTNREACFDGYAGIIRHYSNRHAEAALFRGRSIAAAGIVATLMTGAGQADALAFTVKGDSLRGHFSGEAAVTVKLELPSAYAASTYKLYVNGEACKVSSSSNEDRIALEFMLPQGRSEWQWTCKAPTPAGVQGVAAAIASPYEVELKWEAVAGADRYELAISEDGCRSWKTAASDVRTDRYQLAGLRTGTKMHVRVRAMNKEAAGSWSEPFPVYVSEDPPETPEGLRLLRMDGQIKVTWGMVLGTQSYRLYRRRLGQDELVLLYEGRSRVFVDSVLLKDDAADYAYSITAVNGNGESARSPERDTCPGGLLDWDPRPDEPFRRYIRSHEYGYNGFHYWDNEQKGSLAPYPQ